MLWSEADQWPIVDDLAEETNPIGFHHPFAVRCLERWRSPRAAMALRVRWEQDPQIPKRILTTVETLPATDFAAYCLSHPELLEEEYAKLQGSGQVLCVLFDCAVDPSDKTATRSFHRILQAGIPAVVWHRQSPEAGTTTHKATLSSLVQGGPMQTLDCAVWEQRRQQQITHTPDQVCRNIGLLYEDPSRLPPDLGGGRRYSSPR
jgi:hypothetical protein